MIQKINIYSIFTHLFFLFLFIHPDISVLSVIILLRIEVASYITFWLSKNLFICLFEIYFCGYKILGCHFNILKILLSGLLAYIVFIEKSSVKPFSSLKVLCIFAPSRTHIFFHLSWILRYSILMGMLFFFIDLTAYIINYKDKVWCCSSFTENSWHLFLLNSLFFSTFGTLIRPILDLVYHVLHIFYALNCVFLHFLTCFLFIWFNNPLFSPSILLLN